MKLDIFDAKVIKPFEIFGITNKFFDINIETVINTWIAMFIIFILVLIGRFYIKKNLNPVSVIYEQAIEALNGLCRESFGTFFRYKYFGFAASIFFFTLFCCLVGLLPFAKEATNDVNTAFAIGSLSFFYVQYQKIKFHGLLEYLKEFTAPLPWWLPIMFPVNLIGELSKILSMSFRLFGNILGGAIIFLLIENSLAGYEFYFISFVLSTLITYIIISKLIDVSKYKILKIILNILLGLAFFVTGVQLLFGVFEGFIQSFVVTILTISYLAIGIVVEDVDSHEHDKEHNKDKNKTGEVKTI